MISPSLRLPLTAAALALTALAGCSFTTPISYQSKFLSSPVEPHAAVSLEVVNERAANKGGQTASIGRVRGGYGNPFPVSASSPADVDNSVRAATEDALRLAGIAVDPSAPHTLVARIKAYWMDGFAVFGAWVGIDYELRDRSGNVLWQRPIKTKGGRGMVFSVFEAGDIAREAFGQALEQVASSAGAEFASPMFVQHLAGTPPGSADLAAAPPP